MIHEEMKRIFILFKFLGHNFLQDLAKFFKESLQFWAFDHHSTELYFIILHHSGQVLSLTIYTFEYVRV